ncbi:hypothetical protein SI859A1_03127 [Aurantimonas manganoxydans SI85-9A1]|uniref:Uncharacterized protein n=1 Tax=Aurantimonas manganoxydans (strain ATCC BAA-1229 / DSM 21871 / SI85-9A1) TaxID=287752 RepID=Q1YFQ3_AURMS|nr:hypothetical protein [Aurantimonas manganoxydans]EAS48920.1 hypothetical protein SI859A1_03127 [Aurantimonas manganoxydans SI85-9A1]
MTAQAWMAIAMEWWNAWIAIATRQPVIAAMGLALALLSLILTRSVVIFLAAVFLAVIAVRATAPVDDPLQRQVLAYGSLAVIVAVSLVAMALRLRLRDTRDRLSQSQAREAELQGLYDSEVRWRQAAGDRRETLPPAPSETSEA